MDRPINKHGDRKRSSRSRSPHREPRRHKHYSRRSRSRSRSPHHGHHRHKRHRSRSPPPRPVVLPYNAPKLSKSEYKEYRPLFHSYLDIQKRLNLDELDEREARGRWKSFISRWNHGDLARSWYDPSMLKTAQETVSTFQARSLEGRSSSPPNRPLHTNAEGEVDPDSEDDDFGPAPPRHMALRRPGPTIPRLDDLAWRDEIREEDRTRERSNRMEDVRYERKMDRKAQKERLEDLVPRADPGSRERQLEKKRETTNTLKDFRDAKEAGDVEVVEADLMGDDGLDVYKRRKMEMERKKTEREIKREEIMRARAEEREERLAERRAKEAQTMESLIAMARERFG